MLVPKGEELIVPTWDMAYENSGLCYCFGTLLGFHSVTVNVSCTLLIKNQKYTNGLLDIMYSCLC